MKYRETATLYAQGTKIDAERNTLPEYATALRDDSGNTVRLACYIQRGGTDAKNDASAAGFSIDKGAIGYAPISAAKWIRNGLLLAVSSLYGPATEYWTIKAEPSYSNRFRRTAHVRFLLELQTEAPYLSDAIGFVPWIPSTPTFCNPLATQFASPF